MKNLLFGLVIPPIFALLYANHHYPKSIAINDTIPKGAYSFFENEVKPEKSKPCFNGAYYRKVVSSKDIWLGIAGTVVLPKITFDTSRRNEHKPGQFLDNPSIYMGGSMNGQETDVGLTWAVIREEDGKVSAERKAFRPFFRRAAYPKTGQKDRWQDAPAKKEFYWYPGEKVSMSIQIVGDGKLKFIVEGAGKRFESDFESDGYRMNEIGEFKRVNAIDQVRNEGKPAQPTGTRVEKAVWKETKLFRMHDGKVVQVPMHKYRFTDMRCPDEKYINVSSSKKEQEIGAETISLYGSAN
ncbi:MAG: hypothetical protein P0Y49_14755 [Candidatus Pedobacter colombiensis]|uniref:Uncharacterized protein n=1 Tax=Candidatus Pedobacter colombiensis TaxID=3121371 RepID=A0AAJ5W3W9_9SPHI|nr:hypothetical protein [Pedobacter sp.]WEK18053.1 MAG: hypothetical protein P0Y49_14755 [Pedobacter sp.]